MNILLQTEASQSTLLSADRKPRPCLAVKTRYSYLKQRNASSFNEKECHLQIANISYLIYILLFIINLMIVVIFNWIIVYSQCFVFLLLNCDIIYLVVSWLKSGAAQLGKDFNLDDGRSQIMIQIFLHYNSGKDRLKYWKS